MLNEAGTSHWNDISYYDGIGRPFQTVQKAVKNGVQTGTMLATLQEYDALGRKSNSWLPVPVTANYVDPAALKSIAVGHNGYADSRPYSEPVYEASPLERIVQQYGPGAAWHKAGRPVKTEYLVNGSSAPLNCIHYSVNTSYALSASGVYAPGQLSVVKTMDEDGNASYAFTDKLGRLLLERRLNGTDTHDTYYVYNSIGNLCFVLQPKYQEEASLNKFAFQYRYDDRNRCTWKKMPGAEHILSVYDDADRLIFSQDGVQRVSGRWTYYKYDAFSRLTEQGECTNQNPASGTVVHIRHYYDDYGFVGGTGFPADRFTKDTSGRGKGFLTGSVITALGSNDKIHVAYYYDIKGRETQRVQSNLLGGHDVTNTVYTFTGNPDTVTHTHTASGKPSRTEVYTYTYDHADRLSKVQHRLGNTTVTLYEAFYDDFGRLSAEQYHGTVANRLSYAYNVRGWLTDITGSKFSQNLYYNTGAGTPRYNGNISSMTWKSGNESTVRGYKFTYDGLNRIQNAVYGETANLNANANRFSENVTGYDRNGNIRSLQRFGQTGASSYGLTDNLTFHLDGNRLNRVDDAVSASAYNSGFEFKDGAKQAGEYAYDANGNLTKDLNKGITVIQYNFLNLPSTVTFSDGGTISYTYAADGTKLRTVHKTGGATVTTDYCGSVIYENGIQKLLLTQEGYVTLKDAKYHYYLKDHQGNNRVVINHSGTVEEVNHYYPFGGTFAGTSSIQPYKYNAKELDARKGLNLYDYGARHYDAALGRFTTVDPLAEKYYGISPYAYCGNEPVRRIDPDGKDWRVQIYYDEETRRMQYLLTVNAALYNTSNDQSLDMKALSDAITKQVADAYNFSGKDFDVKMNFNLRVIDSADKLKEREHLIQVVNQNEIGSSSPKTMGRAYTFLHGLDIKVGTVAVSDMLKGSDNRTIGHELGHTGGLFHKDEKESDDNLMLQKSSLQKNQIDPLTANKLERKQIEIIQQNYIHGKLNRRIPHSKTRK